MEQKTKGMAGMRVAEVTVLFWVIKILSTTVGETAADYLDQTLGMGLMITSLLMGILLVLVFVVKLSLRRYEPIAYWSLVILMSIVGTLITDTLVDEMGVDLSLLTVIFFVVMVGGFGFWYRTEKTLSVHSVTQTKREVYYWVIILLAFALGTGAGDLFAEKLAFGYLTAFLVFVAIFAAIGLAYKLFGLGEVPAFWLAFIITRPVGAALGDLLIQPGENGGLGYAIGLVNSLFFIAIFGSISYLRYEYVRISRQ